MKFGKSVYVFTLIGTIFFVPGLLMLFLGLEPPPSLSPEHAPKIAVVGGFALVIGVLFHIIVWMLKTKGEASTTITSLKGLVTDAKSDLSCAEEFIGLFVNQERVYDALEALRLQRLSALAQFAKIALRGTQGAELTERETNGYLREVRQAAESIDGALRDIKRATNLARQRDFKVPPDSYYLGCKPEVDPETFVAEEDIQRHGNGVV